LGFPNWPVIHSIIIAPSIAIKVHEVCSAIDVMHLTKNLCVNILGFLGLYRKSKDTPEAREDQERHKGRDGMHPWQFQGPASYALTKE
jgi:hypothetical protein